MKSILFILLLLPLSSIGQKLDNEPNYFGIAITGDQAFNCPDKALKSGLAGKVSLGLSFTNKKKDFVLFAGVGLKGMKFTLYSAKFRESFISGIQDNYTPIEGHSLDSLVGAKMYNSPGKDFRGTYSQYLHLGLILNLKFRPIIQFYYGKEQLLLRDDSFTAFTDPEHSDINYVDMNTSFYEIKAGIAIPLLNSENKNYCFAFNVGYKIVNYKDFKFNGTSLSSYTNQSFADTYKITGKLTLSIGIIFWSNW